MNRIWSTEVKSLLRLAGIVETLLGQFCQRNDYDPAVAEFFSPVLSSIEIESLAPRRTFGQLDELSFR